MSLDPLKKLAVWYSRGKSEFQSSSKHARGQVTGMQTDRCSDSPLLLEAAVGRRANLYRLVSSASSK